MMARPDGSWLRSGHGRLDAALLHRHEIARFVAGVNLPRTGDLLLGSSIISCHCASQPTVRGMANSTVNISGLKPMAWYMMPE